MLFGAMFHHFKYGAEESRPGAISEEQFNQILNYLSRESSIVGVSEFRSKLSRKSPNESAVVLTFDDGLASHYHLVRPVLKKFGIQAVFAVYSSIFTRNPTPLELFAAFRSQAFESFSDFWSEFSTEFSRHDPRLASRLSGVDSERFLSNYSFYSFEERKFRYARDVLLRNDQYEAIMWQMIRSNTEFDHKKVLSELWLSESQLKEIWEDGHEIALHSHTHPTRIDLLSRSEQEFDYAENLRWLSGLVARPTSVAHPCGRYNRSTLDVLKSLGIDLGFKSNFDSKPPKSALEVSRIDHTNLLSWAISGINLPH